MSDPENKHDEELNRIRSISERISTHFGSYLLIAKTDKALFYKASDRDWARLAAEKYAENCRNEDLLTELAKMLTEAEEQEDLD